MKEAIENFCCTLNSIVTLQYLKQCGQINAAGENIHKSQLTASYWNYTGNRGGFKIGGGWDIYKHNRLLKPGMVVHTFNTNSQEAEAGESLQV